MTNTLQSEPWRNLPDSIADLVEPELEAVTAEILATIATAVPEYARPLEGRFGRGIRTGVSEALKQFVALIRDPEAGRGLGREVYVALGRGELRQGRTLDSLQAAYRVGARVAWRHLAQIGRQVHHCGNDEVGDADEPVPEQDYRRQRGEEGEHHGAQVGDLLRPAHLVHATQLTLPKAIKIRL